jgi:hypothetical protein
MMTSTNSLPQEALGSSIPVLEVLAGGCPLIKAGLVHAVEVNLQSPRITLTNKKESTTEMQALTMAEQFIARYCGDCSGVVLHSPRATTTPGWAGQSNPAVEIISNL